MGKEINGFLKVWKPTYFQLDYDPAEGYCINISLKVNNPCVRKRFLMDYGSPFSKDVPTTYHKVKPFVDNTKKMYQESLAHYEKALEDKTHKIEALRKNPLSQHPGSHEYISIHLLVQDEEGIRWAIKLVKGNISFVEQMLVELNEIKQEFKIKDL